MQTTSDARKRSLQSGRTELDRIMRRTNELDTLLQKLYEDYALGRLPEKRHAKLSAQYEAEQAQLEQRSAELMEQMNAEQEESVNVDRFMELVSCLPSRFAANACRTASSSASTAQSIVTSAV